MELTQRISDLIEPTIADLGFELVRVQIIGDRHMILQIMAEPSDGRGMNVDDCATLSRAISALMDVEDPISQAYTLEVSSPGLDRPLTRRKDFLRHVGYEAKAELAQPQDGQRRFKGWVRGMEADAVLLELEDGTTVALPFDGIVKAKLVLNDHLLAMAGETKRDEADRT
ncbi:hypothetical protein JCM17960_11090 [Magnetospira thiophila]